MLAFLLPTTICLVARSLTISKRETQKTIKSTMNIIIKTAENLEESTRERLRKHKVTKHQRRQMEKHFVYLKNKSISELFMSLSIIAKYYLQSMQLIGVFNT